jgi:ubiquitin carboxyl-terminal hydrolase 22/27/51
MIQPTFIPEFMPKILILHLARFKLARDAWVKNNVRVRFPELLLLEEMFHIDMLYRLEGFVSHRGTMEGGHYTAVARINDEFCLFDDETVTQISVEGACSMQAYLLFYQKIE